MDCSTIGVSNYTSLKHYEMLIDFVSQENPCIHQIVFLPYVYLFDTRVLLYQYVFSFDQEEPLRVVTTVNLTLSSMLDCEQLHMVKD